MPNPTAAERNSVARNAKLNLIGSVIPICVTLATVPPYLKIIGDVRFGVLALIWVFLGYFGIFDMGLGRATSKYLAEIGPGNSREAVFWTAGLVNLAFGVVGGLLLLVGARATMSYWLKAEVAIQAEALRGLIWLAIAVPMATLTSVLIGALEGCEQFGVVNVQQIGATTAIQVIPLAIAYRFGPRIDTLLAAVTLTRMAANIPLLLACAKYVPLRSFPAIDKQWIRSLFSYGGWITISGIVGPLLLTSADRAVIGFVQGPQAVTYFSIPYNFANRLAILPASIGRALFPRFSAQSPEEARELANRAILSLAAVMTPIVVITLFAVQPFFRWWIGAAAAGRSTFACELMLLGIWMNSIGWVPSIFVQGQGRPDLTAKVHVIEVLPFLGLLWAGTYYMGVPGAAAAWALRMVLDTGLLILMAEMTRAVALRLLPSILVVVVAFAAAVMAGQHVGVRLLLAGGIGLASLLIAHATSPETTWIALREGGLMSGTRKDGAVARFRQ